MAVTGKNSSGSWSRQAARCRQSSYVGMVRLLRRGSGRARVRPISSVGERRGGGAKNDRADLRRHANNKQRVVACDLFLVTGPAAQEADRKRTGTPHLPPIPCGS